MKKNKVLLTKTGDTYNCRYVLDQTDIIDEKVDKGVSGKFPQIIPCRLEEKDNQREFIYEIGNKVQLTEFLKKEINKKQMLTLLYNLLSGLEAFGMNMISLSYVAKDIQYVFVAPESLNVYFIVAGVDKEITDLNEVRNFVKDVICNAHYFEMDRDNYVARLITFTNKLGTFSVGDMKEFVNQLLIDMGIHIEEEKKKTEKKEEKTANDKVSRIGVMQNNAKMVQPGASAGGSVPPMPNRQVPPMPNGQPMPGRPMPMQMGPDGKPMNGQPMPHGQGPGSGRLRAAAQPGGQTARHVGRFAAAAPASAGHRRTVLCPCAVQRVWVRQYIRFVLRRRKETECILAESRLAAPRWRWRSPLGNAAGAGVAAATGCRPAGRHRFCRGRRRHRTGQLPYYIKRRSWRGRV